MADDKTIKGACQRQAPISSAITIQINLFLFLCLTKLLNVDSVLHLETLQNRGLVELLTTTKFLNYAGLLKLSLELLQCSLDVLAIFNWYNNHAFAFNFYMLNFLLFIAVFNLRVQNYCYFSKPPSF